MVFTSKNIAKNIKKRYTVKRKRRKGGIRLNTRYITDFEARQEMRRDDFEIFLRNDAEASGVGLHNHSFYELYCQVSGEVYIHVDGRRYAMRPGTLLLIAPGELHRPEYPDPEKGVERIVLWLNPSFIRSLTDRLPRIQTTLLQGLDTLGLIEPDAETYELLTGLLSSLLREKALADPDSDYLSRLVVTQLLIHLSRYLATAPERASVARSPRYAEVLRVYEYIGEHLRDSGLTVGALADRFFMDKNTLTRQFKRLFGLTPGECVRRRRLELAQGMIARGVGMQQACAECGFSDYSAFYRAFRQAYGASPRAYAASQGGQARAQNDRQEASAP